MSQTHQGQSERILLQLLIQNTTQVSVLFLMI